MNVSLLSMVSVFVSGWLMPGPYADDDSFVFVSLLEKKTIVSFRRDTDSGRLTRVGETTCPGEPANLAATNDGRTLFVSLRSTGQLAAYRIDMGTGALELLNVVQGGDDPAFLRLDQTETFLITAYYVSNRVSVHRVHADGRLSEEPVCVVATDRNAHGVAIDQTNRFVYVSHTGANRIDQFAFDAQSGELSHLEPPFVVARSGENPRHIVIHPSGRWLFSSNEAGASQLDGASLYRIDSDRKTLSEAEAVSSLTPEQAAALGPAENSTSECLLTPDGRFLYVANRGDNSLAIFAVNEADGRLTRLAVQPVEAVPRSFSISQDGRFLYVAGEASGRVAVFEIPQNGILRPVEVVESGPVSWCVLAVSGRR